MATGRELFRCFLEGAPFARPAFVPMVRGLVARVGNQEVQAFTQDPTAWANLLVKTADLFNLDGVVAGLDFTLLAEACGCPLDWRDDRPCLAGPARSVNQEPEQCGRLKVALEKARRVFDISRPSRACVAAMTGPLTLAAQLFGPEEGPKRLAEVKPLVVRVAEAFCQTRPDVLLFLEGRALAQGKIAMPQRKIYNTLKNLAAHYDIPVGMFLSNYDQEAMEGLPLLKMDFHVLGSPEGGGPPPLEFLRSLAGLGLGLGVGLPLADPEAARVVIEQGLELYRRQAARGIFFTSLGPAQREVDLATLHQLVKEISRVQL